MTDGRAEIRATLTWASALVDQVPDEQLTSSTPCTDWDVAALLNHMIGGNLMYAMAAEGAAPDWDVVRENHVASGAANAYARSADRAAAAWDAVDLSSKLTLPYGVMPATFSIGTHQMDHLLHGWDLAVALGLDRRAPSHLVAFARATVEALPAEMARGPRVFAAEVAADPTTSELDQLAAWCGRSHERVR